MAFPPAPWQLGLMFRYCFRSGRLGVCRRGVGLWTVRALTTLCKTVQQGLELLEAPIIESSNVCPMMEVHK